MLAPTWKTQRRGLLARLPAARASRLAGLLLHSDSRFSRWFRNLHFSKRRFRRHFAARPELEHSVAVASWLFQRPRPYIQTDGAVMHGLLDPQFGASGETSLAQVL